MERHKKTDQLPCWKYDGHACNCILANPRIRSQTIRLVLDRKGHIQKHDELDALLEPDQDTLNREILKEEVVEKTIFNQEQRELLPEYCQGDPPSIVQRLVSRVIR